MRPANAALLTALVIALIVAFVFVLSLTAPGRDRYRSGPENVGLYDRPYKGYPHYEGRHATWWDGDRRCAAFCQTSPCAVWCR